MKVIVFGSINMDLVVTTPHLPQPGETLTGHAFFSAPGAKGPTRQQLPAFPVAAIDSVAVGDACSGGLAAGLCAGLPVADALLWGMAAGALVTTRRGAQDALPDRPALLALLSHQSQE